MYKDLDQASSNKIKRVPMKMQHQNTYTTTSRVIEGLLTGEGAMGSRSVSFDSIVEIICWVQLSKSPDEFICCDCLSSSSYEVSSWTNQLMSIVDVTCCAEVMWWILWRHVLRSIEGPTLHIIGWVQLLRLCAEFTCSDCLLSSIAEHSSWRNLQKASVEFTCRDLLLSSTVDITCCVRPLR